MSKALRFLREDQEAAQRYLQASSKSRAVSMLERAQKELNQRLAQAEGLVNTDGSTPFSIAQMRAALAQVRAVLVPLTQGLAVSALEAGKLAAGNAAKDALQYVQAAEDEYGLGRPLPLDAAQVSDAAVHGTETSLARRIASDPLHPGQPGVTARYGLGTMTLFESTLQQRLLQGKPWELVKNDLVADSPFLQGKPAFWAERLLRTEATYAANKGNLLAIQQVEAVIGPMLKILCATFDDRTGADSYAVHGQIRKTNESFQSWFGAYNHPPNRPNDREVVVPHNMSWPLPPQLKQLSDGEVAARWAYEGRKGSPPPRPLMSTVEMEQVGKAPPPAVTPSVAPPNENDIATVDHAVPDVLPVPAPEPVIEQPVPLPVLPPRKQRARRAPAPSPAPSVDEVERSRTLTPILSPLLEKASLKALGGGANDSQIATWQDETGIERKAVWKPAKGEERGLRYSIKAGTYHKREAAAFALDQMMGGTPVVPPTVSRTLQGEAGSMQSFVEGSETATAKRAGISKRLKKNHPMGEAFFNHPTARRMQALDYLTANTDRHEGNFMIDPKGNFVAIDNGLAFPNGKPDRFLMLGKGLPDEQRQSLLTMNADQQAMLARLEPEAVGRMLFDHGLEERAVHDTLGRLMELKRNPNAIVDSYAYYKYNTPLQNAERWVTDGWYEDMSRHPETKKVDLTRINELKALVSRIKPPAPPAPSEPE